MTRLSLEDNRGHDQRPRRQHLAGPDCWQALHLSSGRILSCGIFGTDAPGVEVRAGYSNAQLLRSQHAADVETAREIAEEWQQATAAHGGFTKLNGEPFG